MKQDSAIQKQIGEYLYYIRPFPAFTAARMTAKLGKIVGPVLGRVSPALSAFMEMSKDEDTPILEAVGQLDLETTAESLGLALAEIDPDALEEVLRLLLIQHGSISYRKMGSASVSRLTEDDANEIFCQALDEMLALAVETVKVNFSGFFKRLAAQYGLQLGTTKRQTTKNTDGSTEPVLQMPS